MAFKIVLICAICFQVLCALLALILNFRYRWHISWLLISAAAILMAIERFATLSSIWNLNLDVYNETAFWLAISTSLLVSVLLVGGVALIEPLFREYEFAKDKLSQEKSRLEHVVQANEEEMRLARDIQRNLLPSEESEIPGFSIAADSKAAEWTSGDYYDYIPLDDDRMLVVIADVSGHGAGPALLMAEARALLRSLALSQDDPGTILSLANQVIFDDVSDGRFITMFLARIDSSNAEFVFAAAGHSAYLVSANGTPSKTFGSDCPPLGVLRAIPVETAGPVQMEAGDVLVVPTDGILETSNLRGEQFGKKRTIESVKRERRRSAHQIVNALFSEVETFADYAPREDDNTVVIVKRT